MPPWEKYQKPDYSNPNVVASTLNDLYGSEPTIPPWEKYKNTQPAAPQVTEQPKGYLDRTMESIKSSAQKGADIITSGNGNPLANAIQVAGEAANMVSAPIAEAGVSVFESLPQAVQDYLSSKASNLSQSTSELYKSGIDKLADTSAGQAIGDFGIDKPNLQAGLQQIVDTGKAAANIATTLSPNAAVKGKTLENAVSSAATPLVNKAIDSNLAKDISSGRKIIEKPPIVTAKAVRDNAGELYKQASELGGDLSPNFTNKFVDKIVELTPQTEKGKVLAGDSPFTKVVEKIQSFKDSPISLKEAQEIDEYLGDLIDSHYVNGRLEKQGKKILDIQSNFREMIDNAAPEDVMGGKHGFQALSDARTEWSRSARLNDIERIIARAEQMDNPATGMKNGFRTLYNNPSRMRGFTPAQRNLIKRAAEGNMTLDALRTAGSRLISMGIGTHLGGLGGAGAGYIAGTASRKIADSVGAKNAEKIAGDIINEKGGITKPMSSQVKKVIKRQQGE